jgi:predicted TIM-barrel fold metal-dependent hydrolase
MIGNGHTVIALEEHYFDAEIQDLLRVPETALLSRMEDFQIRLSEMDRAGIDMQILSHAPPGLQRISAGIAPDLAQRVNDRLALVVAANPLRFAAFASLPTTSPKAAAEELERTVSRLGFKGAMIHGLTEGMFLDEPRFWPILEMAERLDVPIYLHPADPHPSVQAAYFEPYSLAHPNFPRAAWGFTIETGTQALRLVLSGAFDRYPNLKIILGHLGETLPFLVSRIDESLAREDRLKNFRQYFSRHFYITTSGFFSDPALLCCIQELGLDRIMFSVDWPFASNSAAVSWIEHVALCDEDKAKILSGNVRRLLKLS